MSRSLAYLRRGLLGTALLVSLGFGATQAFATPDSAARQGSCRPTGFAYLPINGCPECPNNDGYCNGKDLYCVCNW